MQKVVESSSCNAAASDVQGKLYFHIRSRLAHFVKVIRNRQVCMRVTCQDAMFLGKAFPDNHFDRITASNIADKYYCGAEATVYYLGKLLRRQPKARLVTSFMGYDSATVGYPQVHALLIAGKDHSLVYQQLQQLAKGSPEDLKLTTSTGIIKTPLPPWDNLNQVLLHTGIDWHLRLSKGYEGAQGARLCIARQRLVLPFRGGLGLNDDVWALPYRRANGSVDEAAVREAQLEGGYGVRTVHVEWQPFPAKRYSAEYFWMWHSKNRPPQFEPLLARAAES